MAEQETDWKSMAYSLIPAGVGLLAGGGLGALSGFATGVGNLEEERQKVKEYNDALEFKRAENARQEETMNLARMRAEREGRYLGIAEQTAQQQAEQHGLTMGALRRQESLALRTDAGRAQIRATLTPAQATEFDADPERFMTERAKERERVDLVTRQTPIVAALIKSGRLNTGGAPASAVVNGFGDKAVETLLQMENLDIQRQRLGIERSRASQESADRIVYQYDNGGFLVSTPGGIKYRDATNFGVPEGVTGRINLQNARKRSETMYKESLSLQQEYPDPQDFYNSPQNQIREKYEAGGLTEQQYGAHLTAMLKSKQAAEEAINQAAVKEFGRTRGWTSPTPEHFEAWKTTKEGKDFLFRKRKEIMGQRASSLAMAPGGDEPGRWETYVLPDGSRAKVDTTQPQEDLSNARRMVGAAGGKIEGAPAANANHPLNSYFAPGATNQIDTRGSSEKPVIRNPDGTVSTEKTIGIEADGKHYLIPTIINGVEVSKDEAIRQWRAGKNKPVGIYGSREESDRAAQARTQRLSRELAPTGNVNPQNVRAEAVATWRRENPRKPFNELTAAKIDEISRRPEVIDRVRKAELRKVYGNSPAKLKELGIE